MYSKEISELRHFLLSLFGSCEHIIYQNSAFLEEIF